MNGGVNKCKMVEFLDSIFMINGEMVKDNGEDSYAFSVKDNRGAIGVFDGCGGIGSRKYDVYGNKSGAYVASRVVSESFYEWFESFFGDNQTLSENSIDRICLEMRERFNERLKNAESRTSKSMIKGSLTKNFPTTASVIMLERKEDVLKTAFIWAGDSRGFILTPEGLTQVTKDDVEGEEDALLNLSNDGRLSNFVSADGNYLLNSIMITPPEAGIFITATDGCFGYFVTPMEFEYMLLETLSESNNMKEWKQKINQSIRKVTGDDYTMGVAVYGYGNFKLFKKSYSERKKALYKNYISKLKDVSEAEKNYLWNKYKKIYYRGFN